jgi:hypothetical protein
MDYPSIVSRRQCRAVNTINTTATPSDAPAGTHTSSAAMGSSLSTLRARGQIAVQARSMRQHAQMRARFRGLPANVDAVDAGLAAVRRQDAVRLRFTRANAAAKLVCIAVAPWPGPPARTNSGAAAARRLSAGTTAMLNSMLAPPGCVLSSCTLSTPQRAGIDDSRSGCSRRTHAE